MPIDIWTTHALDKLFPESEKPGDAACAIALKAARNETEDAQAAVRIPKGMTIARAGFTLPELRGPSGTAIAAENLSARWVWYTYVLNNPPENRDPATYLRKAPAFFPDAFLEEEEIAIRDEWTQPLWVSARVPEGTPPGEYAGELGIHLVDGEGARHEFAIPLTLTVWPFTLPSPGHLRHTEWMFPSQMADYYHLEMWSEEFWGWIERIAADMGRHRQDMILTNFMELVGVTRGPSGTLTFDFTCLDRWVEIFKRAGVEWIEGGHVATRAGGWESEMVWSRFPIADADETPLDTSRGGMSDDEFAPYMEGMLKAVHAHLAARGWQRHYVQHISDEPVPANEASWRSRAARVREWLPGTPIIDAVMSEGLEGSIDIRVPQIQHITPQTPRHPGEALWSYVCLGPQGPYPNRFLDYPSIRNRIIYWLSWSLKLEGFLHWGYNYWSRWGNLPACVTPSPWLDATAGSIYCVGQDSYPLPAGDPHIVYPGKRGICSSIRWEVIRKGFEDFEYLYLLEQVVADGAQRDSPAHHQAEELLRRVREEIAPAPLTHTRDDRLLLRTRDEIGALLAELAPDV